jgi:hypothetical protein
VQRRSGKLVDGDREFGYRHGAVNREPGFEIFHVEEVEATPPQQAVRRAAQPRIGDGDACRRPGPRRPAKLLQVQAGQLWAKPPSVLSLAWLNATQQGHPVALGRPADPLSLRPSAGVGGIDFRKKGADPENVHA